MSAFIINNFKVRLAQIPFASGKIAPGEFGPGVSSLLSWCFLV